MNEQFEQLFGEFFGNTAPGARGADRRIPMPVTLEEAASGASKSVKVTREARCAACKATIQDSSNPPCEPCQGKRRVLDERTFTVKVPAGIDDGQVLRLAGLGDEAPLESGRPGDLMVEVMVLAHPRLRRVGVDLFVEVDVDPETARRGGRVKVPVLDGERWIMVPAGTRSGAEVRLAGFGAVRLGAEPVPIPEEVTADPYRSRSVGGHRGDQIVTLVVGEPIADDEDEAPKAGRASPWAAVALVVAVVGAVVGALILGR